MSDAASDVEAPTGASPSQNSKSSGSPSVSTPGKTSSSQQPEDPHGSEVDELSDSGDPPTESLPHATQQPATPRPFPLSPPVLTQALDESDSHSDDAVSDTDNLPTLIEMLAKTRPSQKSNQGCSSGCTSTMTMASASSSKMNRKSHIRTTPIKRPPTDSPRLPNFSPTRSARKEYNLVTTPRGEYIEILSSDNELPPSPLQAMPSAFQTQRPRPVAKQKRKRARSESSATVAAPIAASPSSPQIGAHASSSLSRFPLPRKRARLENTPVQHRKHPVHWQLDGNVLVQAGPVRFKLHRSRLSRQSIWFREAFEKAAKAATPEANVIFLDPKEVKLKDFEVLLDALDNAITFVYTPPSFRTMASILRASYALAFQGFEEWAIQYLQSMWSPRLEDLTTDRIPFATESIMLARRCKVPGVLKRAMYELVRLEGFGQHVEDDGEDVYERRDEKDERQGLPTSVVAALVRGREKLTSMWMLAAAALLKDFEPCAGETTPTPTDVAARPSTSTDPDALPTPTPSQPSALPNQCTTLSVSLSIQAHTKIVHTSGIFEDFHADPLCGLQALINAPWVEEGFCSACVERRQTIWSSKKERVWENLSIWFALNDGD